MRNLESGQTASFSIHQVAERQRLDPSKITSEYDSLECQMLAEFSGHIGGWQGMKYLHWNMRDVNFGFQALQHRASVHGFELHSIPEADRHDLSRLMVDLYGVGYVAHPRLENLLTLNEIKPRDFLSGKQEADAFDSHEYVALHQSTLRKVHVLANLAGRANVGTLKTNATWWEVHGGSARDVVDWLVKHPLWGLTMGILAVAGIVVGLWFGFS
ncbi:MAG: hypothetical protein J4F45_06815 [Pseudomonadales bacterium]|nr:hypothetical protein [Pseudomonadales bacterium]